MIYCGTKGLLRNVPVNKVKEFEAEYLNQLELRHRPTLDAIRAGKIDDSITTVLETVAKEISSKY
jgi:F-type H+-transporting ATPase subunit alpha